MKNNSLHIFLLAQFVCWLVSASTIAQNGRGAVDRILIQKNFFIVTAVEQAPKLKSALPTFSFSGKELKGYLFTTEATARLDSQLLAVYDQHKILVGQILDKKIRPSGYYGIYHQLDNRRLWLSCWKHYFAGINYIINGYGLSGRLRYPAIDSASYPIKSSAYQTMASEMLWKQQAKSSGQTVFYEPPLKAALGLLKINGRDEAACFEPLEKKENKPAKRQVRRTDFSSFAFTALVIPGEGPERYGIKLSEGGKARCKLAAEWYEKKKAPFIIVSGGYCHPFKTLYCEALEMKHHLMEVYHIPAKAIIIDPHARHTTTNFRNACRYLIGYGFPDGKPAMLLTTKDQADYIADPRFETRNRRELGYLPYADLKRLSDLEFSFHPVYDALFRDPLDPLDP